MCINMASYEKWQNTKQKMSERGQHLLESGLWSDCSFIVGEEQQPFEGHKLILAMSSPVFDAMFFGGMSKNDLIRVEDVQPEVFKTLLNYIYTDKIELSSCELACDLWRCADKYILPSLVKECIKYISNNLSPKNACRIYETAKFFEEFDRQVTDLKDRCLLKIRTRTEEVLKESTWEEVELETLFKVLDQDELQITSEIELFNAVERWAKAECRRKSLDPTDGKSLRSVIGDALSKIRFLNLTPQEFAININVSPLLTKDEHHAIIMNISYGNKIPTRKENKLPMPENFSTDRNNRKKPVIQTPNGLFSQQTNITSTFGTAFNFGTTNVTTPHFNFNHRPQRNH